MLNPSERFELAPQAWVQMKVQTFARLFSLNILEKRAIRQPIRTRSLLDQRVRVSTTTVECGGSAAGVTRYLPTPAADQ